MDNTRDVIPAGAVQEVISQSCRLEAGLIRNSPVD